MTHTSLPLATETVGSAPRLCTARRADPAHRLARADARAGQDIKDSATRTEHDQGQSRPTRLADTIGRVPVQTLTEMTHANSAASGKLHELRTLASHLTAGSLLQAATLQLIAEQENTQHRYAPARIAELSRQG
ncbi:hypothetical protein OR16_32473 [Cupriavidus basilensis OR16]|uniref:Uncharacterized protein n=1 Tax=Cupriavidus basilensis OR16 TaxID=1127483 RepID=H1SDZ6_9BURK|nr:hypothetical protein [Cupriavidus basilensis]EHP39255.1 hypothetical protein OR16_32473 [Cupriavidus basilensis OR16]